MTDTFPPTIQQIADFAKEKGFKNFPADDFWNYYEARDWYMTRTVRMKKWKNAVHLWGKRQSGIKKKSVLDQMESDGLL